MGEPNIKWFKIALEEKIYLKKMAVKIRGSKKNEQLSIGRTRKEMILLVCIFLINLE